MPNDLAPAVIDATQAQLREELALERGRREGLERFASAPRPSGPPPPPEKDFALELGLTPEQTAAFKGAVGQGVRQLVGPALSRLDQARAEGEQRAAYSTALDMALQLNPDIAADQTRFSAATAAVEYELRQSQRSLSPGEFIRASVGKYRELFPTDEDRKRTKAPPPDFVEGASAPAAAGRNLDPKEPEVKQLSKLQKDYGDEDGEIIPVDDDIQKSLERITEEYVAGRNDYLDGRNVRSFMPKVVQPLRKRRKARAAAAAGK